MLPEGLYCVYKVNKGGENKMLDYFVKENILGQVSIQLEMTSHDWSKLKTSDAWSQVKQILMESGTQSSCCYHHNYAEEIQSEQTDNEYMKEQFGIYSRYVKSLSTCTRVLTVISIIALTISIVALIV